jgi:hypothetical protein
MDKKAKVLSKSSKIIISHSKLNNSVMRKLNNKNTKGEVQPNKENWSPLRKALNELDPNFDNYIRMVTKPPTLKMKDLKAHVKKEQERKKKQK